MERGNEIKQMMEEATENKTKPIPPCNLVSDPLNFTQSRNGQIYIYISYHDKSALSYRLDH